MTRLGILVLALIATPAMAEVKSSSESGFLIEAKRVTKLSPVQIWARLLRPADWWASAHSWSGKAANLSIEPRVGGCFCERWDGNEVEHARVIASRPEKMLRLSGGLGPLQMMGVAGVLTFELKPGVAGTDITMSYDVGGHFPVDPRGLAPLVDKVMTEQIDGLAGK